MKLLRKKQQIELLIFIVMMAKKVRLSSFEGETSEQMDKFEKFVDKVTYLVKMVYGFKGLVFLEHEVGISAMLRRIESEKKKEE